MAKRLTKKEKDFAKEYAKTGNGVQSALKAYDTDNYKSASTIADDNLDKPRVLNEIEVVKKTIADQIPDELLVEVHLEGLQASKEVWKNNNESGEIEKVSEEPDYAVRHKYLESGYKLKGSFAPEKNQIVNVQVNIEQRAKIEKLANETAEKLYAKETNENNG